jgi:hypothetical protein
MMSVVPSIFIGGERLLLDAGHYSALAAGDYVGNIIQIWPAGEAQCDSCGRNISETGNYIGNPTVRTEPGIDECSVECRECDQGYPVVWVKEK